MTFNSPCRYCRHGNVSNKGWYCSEADVHTTEYGLFWNSNVCIHDPNQKKLISLFTPISDTEVTKIEKIILDLRNEVNALKSENNSLRRLIK